MPWSDDEKARVERVEARLGSVEVKLNSIIDLIAAGTGLPAPASVMKLLYEVKDALGDGTGPTPGSLTAVRLAESLEAQAAKLRGA